jgi:nucleoside-diphosphate-sugar epimerase
VHGRLRRAPIDEQAPCRPFTIYGRAKHEGERIVRRYLDNDLVRVVVARLTSVYGPGSRCYRGLCNDIWKERLTVVGRCDQLGLIAPAINSGSGRKHPCTTA